MKGVKAALNLFPLFLIIVSVYAGPVTGDLNEDQMDFTKKEFERIDADTSTVISLSELITSYKDLYANSLSDGELKAMAKETIFKFDKDSN